MPWVDACDAADVDAEDVIRFDHAGRSYAICITDDGDVFCIDGYCPIDGAHLAGGLVQGSLIECPAEGCLYDLRNGQSKGAVARPSLGIYPARVVAARVQADLPG